MGVDVELDVTVGVADVVGALVTAVVRVVVIVVSVTLVVGHTVAAMLPSTGRVSRCCPLTKYTVYARYACPAARLPVSPGNGAY